MDAATGFAMGAAALMAAGFALYNVGGRDHAAHRIGWTGWCCGQIVLLMLIARIGAPALALLAPGLGAACALPMALWGRGRTWSDLILPGAVFLWCLLLIGPVGHLAVTAEIGMVFALLSGLVGVAASWPLLRAACTDRPRKPSLAWFLWSASYGLAVLALMAAGADWPFLVFPVLAQGIHLIVGLVTFGSDSATSGRHTVTDRADIAI